MARIVARWFDAVASIKSLTACRLTVTVWPAGRRCGAGRFRAAN